MSELLVLREWGPFVGLCLVLVIAFMRGSIVPGKEARYWREAFFEEQRQKRELIDAGNTTRDVLRATQAVIEERRP